MSLSSFIVILYLNHRIKSSLGIIFSYQSKVLILSFFIYSFPYNGGNSILGKN